MTAALLFPHWTFEPGEADVTVMRVTAVGMKDGRKTKLSWDLYDRHDATADLRSMSRTTAFAATSMATLIARGVVSKPGVHQPEVLAREPGLLWPRSSRSTPSAGYG